MRFMIVSFLQLFLVIGVHIRRSQARQLQRGKHESIPRKYAMAAKVRVPRKCCQVFLAGREIGSGVDFGPEAIGDGFVSPLPAMEFSSNISADFDLHPTAAVVIHPVFAMVTIVRSELIVAHRVEGFRKIFPPWRSLLQTQ